MCGRLNFVLNFTEHVEFEFEFGMSLADMWNVWQHFQMLMQNRCAV